MSSLPAVTAQKRWPAATRFGFRFAFVYLILYNLPFPLDYVPGTDGASAAYQSLLHKIVAWVGAHGLHLKNPISNFAGASGDKIYDYVLMLCFVSLAVVATAIWSLEDRKRANYEVLYGWLRVYVRFALGAALVGYGCAKLFPSQFPRPAFITLTEPIGQASPMGLLWTFMGISRPYSIFAGAAEFASGLLLFVPWTAVLGALLGATVMSNIVALNFCYDVPVKLYSLHLLLMCVFIASPAIVRILSLLVLNRAQSPADEALLARHPYTKAILATQVILGLILAGINVNGTYKETAEVRNSMTALPFAGYWNVDEFKVDDDTSNKFASEVPRWTQFILDSPYEASVQGSGGFRETYRWTTNPVRKTLTLLRADHRADTILEVDRSVPDQLILKGPWHGHTIEVHLCPGEMPKFLLLTRGFHWISEYPFNR